MSPVQNFTDCASLGNELDINSTGCSNVSSNPNLPHVSRTLPESDNANYKVDNQSFNSVESRNIHLNIELEPTDGLFLDDKQDSVNYDPTTCAIKNSISLISSTGSDSYVSNDDTLTEAEVISSISQIANINPDLCGMPLKLFSEVYKLGFYYFIELKLLNCK